jgi:hypothetical protein
MRKFEGYVKHIQYFRIEVEAENPDEAKDFMWGQLDDIDWTNPIEIENDIVEIEEIENA